MLRCFGIGLLFVMPLLAVPSSAEEVIRVGIIGLDTSHVPSFTKVINDPKQKGHVPGCKVVAAYPKGSPDIESSVSRVPKYTAELKGMGIEIVDSIEELLTKVDAVLLETNDGRPHLEQLRPVLKAKKPVFIDKPLAGSLKDAVLIYREAKAAGVPIFSSSSLRYIVNGQDVRNGSIGDIVGCDAYSPASLEKTHPDLFWYGIHGVEILYTVMGTGCESVVRVHTEGSDVVVGTWSDGKIGTFRGMRPGKGYGGVAFGTKGIKALGPYAGYQPLVGDIVTFFKTGEVPVTAAETLELYAFMEAADESKRRGGATVKISDVMKAAGAKPGEFSE